MLVQKAESELLPKWINTYLDLVQNLKNIAVFGENETVNVFYFNKTIYFLRSLYTVTKLLIFGQRIFNRLVCNYHVFTKSLISSLKNNNHLTDTLNIRHGLKINILVNKYSENIFHSWNVLLYRYRNIHRSSSNICKMIMEKIIISLKNINYCTHFLLYNLKCYKQYEILNSDSSTQKRNAIFAVHISMQGKSRFLLRHCFSLCINNRLCKLYGYIS